MRRRCRPVSKSLIYGVAVTDAVQCNVKHERGVRRYMVKDQIGRYWLHGVHKFRYCTMLQPKRKFCLPDITLLCAKVCQAHLHDRHI